MNAETPLHLACEGGHAEIVALLLRYGADTSIKNVYKKVKHAHMKRLVFGSK